MPVRRVAPLRHYALQAKRTRMRKHHTPRRVEVFGELNARRRAAQKLHQSGLAAFKRVGAQVLTVELE
jgi:hypothetical protein